MYIRLILILTLGLLMAGCTQKNQNYNSKYFHDGHFKNPHGNYTTKLGKFLSDSWYFMSDNTKDKAPKEGQIPVKMLRKKDLIDLSDNSVIRFGHSTLLIKADNKFILTDPVFSNRASPISFMGPKRFHKVPIAIKNLPYIDIVIISHNHYDHLDEDSIRKLKDKVGHFFAPLGVKKELEDFGVDSTQISELDWWQSSQYEGINVVATPAQHFSGRGLFDRNETFWASWVITTSKTNLFFSGDSGYSVDFKTIGEKYGPFDMTFIEDGAYNERWKEIHMMPSQSIQANLDLKGKIMFPIHNGTFELSTHPWREPFEKIVKLANEKNVQLVHPIMGEAVPILKFEETPFWWRKK